MNPFPIFLNDLANRPCLVFGADHEAERKVKSLLSYSASVTVIHPALTDTLQQLFDAGEIAWRARSYRPGDLKHAYLAIASEPNVRLNHAIGLEAEAENVLFNAMDDVPNCNFVSGSVIRQGPLVIAISTSGCAPVLSVRLRERFEKEFGPEYADFLHLMKALRPYMSKTFPEFDERRKTWYELVDGPLFELVKQKRAREVEELLRQYLGKSFSLSACKSIN
ncbi:MAG: bifunctional precorrin-2 dehydrogenase/sirohydrochlorin ferrochelatase [Bacteroidota bacterium]